MPLVARTHGLPAAAAAATMRLPLTVWTSQQAALHRQHLVLLLLPVPQARGVALGSSSTRSRQPRGCRPAWLVVVVGAAQPQLPWKASQGRSRSPSTCRQQVSTALPLHLRGQLPPAGVHQPADEPLGRSPSPIRFHQQPPVQAERLPRHLLGSPTLVWQRLWLCGCSVLAQGLGLLSRMSRRWVRRPIWSSGTQVGSVIGQLLSGA